MRNTRLALASFIDKTITVRLWFCQEKQNAISNYGLMAAVWSEKVGNPGTTPSTYVVIVTGTSGSIMQKATVSLTVQ